MNQSRFSMRTCRFLNPVLKDGSSSFSSLAMKWLIFKKINKNSLNCWAFSWPCLLLPSTSWSCSWVSPHPQLQAFCCWLVGWLHVVWSAPWHVCVCVCRGFACLPALSCLLRPADTWSICQHLVHALPEMSCCSQSSLLWFRLCLLSSMVSFSYYIFIIIRWIIQEKKRKNP